MIRSFAVIGHKGAGRSAVLLALVAHLKSRGKRVGVVRRLQRDDLEIDEPGKDTYAYRMQGAEKVVLSGRRRCATFENRERELSTAEILEAFEGYDFVFFEGYLSAGIPAIEVHRRAAGELIPETAHTRLALCSEDVPPETLPGMPVFSFEQVGLLADFLENLHAAKKAAALCY